MSLKNLLLKNFFTYKIYIYYNLYIRNKAYKKREYYSQWGEDLFIKNYFKNKKDGFYADIGCFHPIMYSNTCLLFNNGWSGLNIDLNKTSIDLFKIMRPNDYNICAALSDQQEETDLFFDHNFSPVNTLSKSVYDTSNKNVSFKKMNKKKISTLTFEDIIKKIPNSLAIDFLNIDCEGYDFYVLKGLNLKKYSPKLICIETHDVYGNPVEMHDKIIKFLKDYNYSHLKRCGPSSFFAN